MLPQITDSTSPAKIAFCLMVHDNVDKIREFAALLIELGHDVFIHLDASLGGNTRESYMEAIRESAPQASFVPSVRCEWGSWNLVEGTLSLVRAVVSSDKIFTHVQLLSGADLPTQNIKFFGDFLMRNHESDFIESTDISLSRWVVHGPEKERFEYFFPFNWRYQRKRFDCAFLLQKMFRVKRRIPCGIKPRLGSQWWTLRLSTCRKLLEFLDQNPAVCKYFKQTLIPDECFFQSLIPHLVNPREIVPRTLTLYQFNGHGKPFIFYDDHLDMIVEQPFFFARKVSPFAKNLQKSMFERARSGPRPEWLDHRAGYVLYKLGGEARRAFRFTDPMVGHIGNSPHHALKNPAQMCVVLVCTDPEARYELEQTLGKTPGIHCVDSLQLPPYRVLSHGLRPALHSFLANEISLSSRLKTCIVTTADDFAEVIEGLSKLVGIRARCAAIETANLIIDQLALRKTLHTAKGENFPLDHEALRKTLHTAQGENFPLDHEAFPVFLQNQHASLVEWIKEEPVGQLPASCGNIVRRREGANAARISADYP